VTTLPRPPDADTLRARAPLDRALRSVGSRVVLWRIHDTIGQHVLAWNQLRRYGPAGGRFDPQPLPPGSESGLGVLYLAAERVDVALAEAFQRTRRVDVTAGGPWLTGLRLTRSVRLLDLAGGWPTRAGASQALCSGPRPRAQAWARAITQAWPELDGVWYPSSMLGGGHCVSLWSPAADALPPTPMLSVPLSHPALWGPLALICERIGYRLG
jgi:hypothetical protein